jgi:hypothetical protein
VENTVSGHYLGDIDRTGRAFSHTAHTADFEKRIKTLIEDKQLDPFNKYLFAFLYYRYYLHEHQLAELADANGINYGSARAADFPPYISAVPGHP